MKLKFWEKPDPTVLPDFIRRAIEAQPRVEGETVSRLNYYTKAGNFSGRKVEYLRVVDPTSIDDSGTQGLSYDDLDQSPDAVLFEGQYDRGASLPSQVVLKDLRAKPDAKQYAEGESPAARMDTERAKQLAIGTKERPIEVLLVEDNPGDVRLTQESLRDAEIFNNINVAEDGETAIAYVKREGDYSESLSPDLILLDLNLPKKSGQEVLEELKADPNLRRIPVSVLTSSQAEEDVLRSTELKANTYISKPLTISKFTIAVEAAKGYWIAMARIDAGSS